MMRLLVSLVCLFLLNVSALAEDKAKCLNLEAIVKAIRAEVKAGTKVQKRLVDLKVISGNGDAGEAWIRENAKSVLKDALIANWVEKDQPVTQDGCASVRQLDLNFIIHSSSEKEIELGLDAKGMVDKLMKGLEDQQKELEKEVSVKVMPGEGLDKALERAATKALENKIQGLVVEAMIDAIKADRKTYERQFDIYRMIIEKNGEDSIRVTQINHYGSEKLGVKRIATVTIVRWGKTPVEDKVSTDVERFKKLANEK